MKTKPCKTCGDVLSIRQFDRGRPICKLCVGRDIWQNMYDKKVCNVCQKEKHLSDYYRGNGRFGYRPMCIECFNEQRKTRYKDNPISEKAKTTEWRRRNKSKVKSYTTKYRTSRRGRAVKVSLQQKREAAKKNRTPRWLTDEHFDQMKGFYLEAARLTDETGIQYEVDHIVPLQGKEVSGLHVPWNLQILTKEENMRKNAKYTSIAGE